jgi:hypothetical protein
MNKTPAPGSPNGQDAILPDLSWIGVTFGTLICGIAVYSEVKFQHTVRALPSGTAIRPMGMAAFEGGLFLLGLLFGVPMSVLGIKLARVERKHASLWLGVVGLVLNLLPLPVTWIMSHQTLRSTAIHVSP